MTCVRNKLQCWQNITSLSPRRAERRGSSVTPFLCGLLNATIWSFPFMSNIFFFPASLKHCTVLRYIWQASQTLEQPLTSAVVLCLPWFQENGVQGRWTCFNSALWLMPSFVIISYFQSWLRMMTDDDFGNKMAFFFSSFFLLHLSPVP